MNEKLDPSPVNLSPEEKEFENNLRPSSFDEFSGQDQVIDNLKIFVEASNPVSYTHLTLPTIYSV